MCPRLVPITIGVLEGTLSHDIPKQWCLRLAYHWKKYLKFPFDIYPNQLSESDNLTIPSSRCVSRHCTTSWRSMLSFRRCKRPMRPTEASRCGERALRASIAHWDGRWGPGWQTSPKRWEKTYGKHTENQGCRGDVFTAGSNLSYLVIFLGLPQKVNHHFGEIIGASLGYLTGRCEFRSFAPMGVSEGDIPLPLKHQKLWFKQTWIHSIWSPDWGYVWVCYIAWLWLYP